MVTGDRTGVDVDNEEGSVRSVVISRRPVGTIVGGY